VGPRPRQSPSLVGYPAADRTVARVARELWGDLDGKLRTEYRFGAGRVAWGRPLDVVLEEMGRPADVSVAGDAHSPAIEWTHRRMADWDLYFLSNPASQARRLEVGFRVSGRVPEIWHADTGETETLALWREEDERTLVSLRLDPCGSAFVLFARRSHGASHFVSIESNSGSSAQGAVAADAVRLLESGGRAHALVSSPGRWMLRRASGKRMPLELAHLPAPLRLAGPWQLTFPLPGHAAAGEGRRPARSLRRRLAHLVSWTDLSDPDARYFSGTAIYRTQFDVPAELLGPGRALWLDLGDVREMAAVRVNGTELGVLWKPPFAVEITAAVRAGRNSLSLRVTNTWRNRLIGDHGKPDAQRDTFVVPMLRKGEPWLPGGPGVEPSPAGLLGPVAVRSIAQVNL
jgi:hypothetical protein